MPEIAGGLALWLGPTEFARHFRCEHDFYLLYLVSHGLVNLGLMFGLLRQELWEYPATLAGAAGIHCLPAAPICPYARYWSRRANLDLIVMGLTWNEYRLRRRG